MIVDTGQTKCYDNTIEISAPQPGQPYYSQDAQYQSNQPRYTLSGDGLTVYDNNTGLVWQRSPGTDGDGSLTKSDKLTWTQAQARPATLNAAHYGGYSDWRLPSDRELESLIEYSGIVPMVPEGAFIMFDAEYFWSATENQDAPATMAWATYFAIGTTQPQQKTNQYKAICVRLGPFFPTEQKMFTAQMRGGYQVYIDSHTNLMWTGDYWYSDTVPVSDWLSALAYCEEGAFGGYTDWRLPNINELRTTYDRTWTSTPPDFPGLSSYSFWTSTSRPDMPDGAYYVTSGGTTGSMVKTLPGAVRCVR